MVLYREAKFDDVTMDVDCEGIFARGRSAAGLRALAIVFGAEVGSGLDLDRS